MVQQLCSYYGVAVILLTYFDCIIAHETRSFVTFVTFAIIIFTKLDLLLATPLGDGINFAGVEYVKAQPQYGKEEKIILNRV